jgi:hypothetical protein
LKAVRTVCAVIAVFLRGFVWLQLTFMERKTKEGDHEKWNRIIPFQRYSLLISEVFWAILT